MKNNVTFILKSLNLVTLACVCIVATAQATWDVPVTLQESNHSSRDQYVSSSMATYDSHGHMIGFTNIVFGGARMGSLQAGRTIQNQVVVYEGSTYSVRFDYYDTTNCDPHSGSCPINVECFRSHLPGPVPYFIGSTLNADNSCSVSSDKPL